MSTEEFIQRMEKKARDAIHQQFQHPVEDDQVLLFLQHHIEEIEAEYWLKHTAQAQPTPAQVLQILVLNPYMEWEFEEDEESYMIDFTLPDDATQYMLCVQFDRDEKLIGISMES